MTRDIPYRERKPKKKLEIDENSRATTLTRFPVPDGASAFKEGYRECVEMYALHSPDKRNVMRILDTHCITLEQACMRANMARESLAQYEGYRQAMKDIAKTLPRRR